MDYSSLVFTITERQAGGYPITAVDQEVGRVSHLVPPPGAELLRDLARFTDGSPETVDLAAARAAGAGLFRWLTAGPLETHFRLVWDRAQREGRGLKLRLSIDPPEISAWPWELLHDPLRDHTFATSVRTPLVRYYDQAVSFGALIEPETELPLAVLLVVPAAPDLDLEHERQLIEDALAPLEGALDLHVLEGVVTRDILAETLLLGEYDILHISGHGGFADGQGYIALNGPTGEPDWLDGPGLAHLCSNHRGLRLVILNVCSSGRVDAGVPFRGIPPQLVRSGVPAVVAMQHALDDQAAALFAREFYNQLCLGEEAGQVDVAVSYARNMLAVNWERDWSYAVPVLFTHSADGVLFSLPQEPAVRAVLDPTSQWARLAMFMGSLEESLAFDEDWAMADRQALQRWLDTLRQAERNYWLHMGDRNDLVRKAARHGLDIVQVRLSTVETRLAALDAAQS